MRHYTRSVVGTATPRKIDELGVIAAIADRFRTALEAVGPDWERLPHSRKRSILKPIEKQLIRELRATSF